MSRTTIPRMRGVDIPWPPVTAPVPGPAGPSAVGFHTADGSLLTTVVTPWDIGPWATPVLMSMQPCGSSPTVQASGALAMPTGCGLQVSSQVLTSLPLQLAGPFRHTICDQPVE